jgi:hypothetical protein
MAQKPKDTTSIIQDITNRYSVTAREARDIVTSVSTYLKTLNRVKPDPRGLTPTAQSMAALSKSGSDVKKQIKETFTAATTGKKGTTAAKATAPREVKMGKKRK